jgi:hypothetical protein
MAMFRKKVRTWEINFLLACEILAPTRCLLKNSSAKLLTLTLQMNTLMQNDETTQQSSSPAVQQFSRRRFLKHTGAAGALITVSAGLRLDSLANTSDGQVHLEKTEMKYTKGNDGNGTSAAAAIADAAEPPAISEDAAGWSQFGNHGPTTTSPKA